MPNTTSYQDLMDRIAVLEREWTTHASRSRPFHKACVICRGYQQDLELLRDTARIAYRIG